MSGAEASAKTLVEQTQGRGQWARRLAVSSELDRSVVPQGNTARGCPAHLVRADGGGRWRREQDRRRSKVKMGGGIADSAHGSRRTRKIECARNESGHGGGAPQCVAGGPGATDVGVKCSERRVPHERRQGLQRVGHKPAAVARARDHPRLARQEQHSGADIRTARAMLRASHISAAPRSARMQTCVSSWICSAAASAPTRHRGRPLDRRAAPPSSAKGSRASEQGRQAHGTRGARAQRPGFE